MDNQVELTFVISHPIQYYSPLFVEIAKSDKFSDFEVLYCSSETIEGALDKQFNVHVKWDIPLLEGYKYRFLKNNSRKPSMYNGFFGLVNFELISILKKKKKGGILIISGWNYFSYVFALFLGKIYGIKVYIRGESALCQELKGSRFKLMVKKMIFWPLFKMYDKFLFIGKQNKLFYEHYGVKEKKLISSPYSVENSRFQSQYEKNIEQKSVFKEALNIPKNKKVILFAGKFTDKKRPFDLLNASLKCSKKEEVFLIFMGEGELRGKMQEFIDQHQMKNVLLTGFINQSELYKYYIVSDLFVLSSGVGETWGLVTNEAMNFGLPCIVSNIPGSQDLVDHGKNGYVYECGDTDQLAHYIDKVVNNELPLESVRQSNLEMLNKHSYKTIIENLTGSIKQN